MTTKSIFSIALVLACLAGALALSFEAYLSSATSPQLWHGYYTVLVSDAQRLSSVQTRLESEGLTAVTSENTFVTFNDFVDEKQVSVGELSDRFDSIDPRYDPYMKELPAYFHQGGWNILYVKSRQILPVAYLRLARALRGLQWRVADLDLRGLVLCVVLWALVVVFVLLRTRRSPIATWALLSAAVAWLAAPVSGSYVATLSAALVYLAWSTAMEIAHPVLQYYLDYGLFERFRLRPVAGVALAAVFAGSVLAGIDGSIVGLLIPATGAMVCLSGALFVWEHFRKLRRQHRLFHPIRILGVGKGPSYIVPRIVETAWIGVALLLSPGIAYLNWGVDVEIPVPVVYAGMTHNSWAALHRLWTHGADPGLPDLADYVAHRAYQAGLSYGRGYSFPIPNERVYESRYGREGKRIVSRLTTVKVYTEEWFQRVLSRPDGIVGMLEEQPSTVLPTTKLLYNDGYPVGFVPIFWLVTLSLLFPALYLRRERGFDTVGRTVGSADTVPAWEHPHRLRLPAKPRSDRRRVAAAEERRDLVSESDR